MHCRDLLVMLCLVACKEDEGTEDFLGSDTSGKPVGSAGGFAAAFGNDLKGSGSAGTSATPGSAAGSAKPVTGSGSVMSGSGSAMSGSGSAMSGSGSAMSGAGSSAPAITSGSAGSGSGSGAKTSSAAGSAATTAQAGSGSGSAKPPTGSGTTGTTPPIVRAHKPVTPPPEIAAIKLTLAPKWERDIDEAATFMRTVDIVSREFTFVFRYGYEDASAPSDRPAYMKWLADKKLLLPANPDKPLLNRQTGGAWYLEGVDGAGAPAFRYLVNYGDKKLVCYGPLYKDTGLGDIRDDAIVQAKAICQSMAI